MPDASALALMRTARMPVILKYFGQILVLLAILTLVPMVVALSVGDIAVSGRYLAIISLMAILALPLLRLPEPRRIERNEALCVTALVFLIAPLLMSYPLMAGGLSWIDAWFEAVSGITTTGLSTLPSVESQSPAFLFGRAWMQWYGGLGIAVLAVALLMGHRVTSKQLLDTAGEEGRTTTARTYARQVLWVYLALTLLGFILIWLGQSDPFVALIHSLAAVSTGGFSGFDASLAAMPLLGQFAVTLLSLAGAVSLPLYFLAVQRRQPQLLLDEEGRTLLLAILLLSLLLALSLMISRAYNWDTALQQGFLLSVSAQSTSGFSSLDISNLDTAAQLLLIMAMLIGGSTGSTAGGLKLIRLLILIRLIQVSLQRITAPPRAVLLPRIGGLRIDEEDISAVLVLFGLWFGVIFISWWVFLLLGEPPLNSLFEVVSAMGTVGLSSGVTRPDLAPPLKVLLCINMLLGRLEIIALLVLLYPRTWWGRRYGTQ